MGQGVGVVGSRGGRGQEVRGQGVISGRVGGGRGQEGRQW